MSVHYECPQCGEEPGNKFFIRGQYCLCGWRLNPGSGFDAIDALRLRAENAALKERVNEAIADEKRDAETLDWWVKQNAALKELLEKEADDGSRSERKLEDEIAALKEERDFFIDVLKMLLTGSNNDASDAWKRCAKALFGRSVLYNSEKIILIKDKTTEEYVAIQKAPPDWREKWR